MDAIPLIQILSVVGIFRALGAVTIPTYLAKGRADIGFIWNFILSIANWITFYYMARYGLVPLAMSFAVLSLLQFAIVQTVTGSLIGLGWAEYLRSLSANTLKSVAMGVIVYGIYLAGTSLKAGDIPLLIIMVAASVALYLAIAWRFSRKYLVELWGFLTQGD
jgi:O-antigen/teichoic acid export membrane protein